MNRQLRGNLPPNEKANGKNRFLSLLLLFMAFVSVQVYAQDVKVSGTINDSMGPIIGANVIEKGTTNGVITDVDGKFTLTVIERCSHPDFLHRIYEPGIQSGKSNGFQHQTV